MFGVPQDLHMVQCPLVIAPYKIIRRTSHIRSLVSSRRTSGQKLKPNLISSSFRQRAFLTYGPRWSRRGASNGGGVVCEDV